MSLSAARERTCARHSCGKPFHPSTSMQKYCTPKCRFKERPASKRSRKAQQRVRKDPELKAYHATLRAMGCIVTGRKDRVTLHHPHSGSMVDRGVMRGGGQKTSDWLCIPLDLELHSMGPEAIDGAKGVLSWEAQYGKQADHIDRLIQRTGIDVWQKAKEAQ